MEEIVFKPKDVKRLFTYGKSICEGKNIGTFVGKDCETEMY